MRRSKSLRNQVGWSQRGLGEFLQVDQSSVARMDLGGNESGPVARLLDALAAGIDRGIVAKGMTPAQALDRLGLSPAVAS